MFKINLNFDFQTNSVTIILKINLLINYIKPNLFIILKKKNIVLKINLVINYIKTNLIII